LGIYFISTEAGPAEKFKNIYFSERNFSEVYVEMSRTSGSSMNINKSSISQKKRMFKKTGSSKSAKIRLETDPAMQIPVEVLGATFSGRRLMFLIKWEGIEEAELIPSEEANVKYTQAVLKFYTDRIVWETDPTKTNLV